MKVAVVIPNWNGIDLIEECLGALAKQTQEHQLIVVDNGSVDGSNKVVREKFPDAMLIEFPDNAGFSGGVNRGIRPALEAGADYVALLNNDAVADPHWLEHLVKTMESDAKVGAVAAKIVTQDGKRIDSTGDFYSTWGFPFPRGRGEEDRGQYDGPEWREIFAGYSSVFVFADPDEPGQKLANRILRDLDTAHLVALPGDVNETYLDKGADFIREVAGV